MALATASAAVVSSEAAMECHCIPWTELPQTSRLFSTFLGNFERVKAFYAHAPTMEGARASARAARMDAAQRAAVAEILREQNRGIGGDASVERNLGRLGGGAAAVVSGQQVGLFGGPAYSFYKALTAIRLARDLTAGGIEAVPVFWMATEDHDLAEVDHCYWLGRGGLARCEIAGDATAGRCVGEVPLGPDVDAVARAAAESLEGEAAAEVAAALRDSYRAGETLGTAFAKLFARLFAERGLILLDPLDARLHALAAPLFARVARGQAELTGALVARGKALERAGFHAQVKVTERNTPLFVKRNGQRLSVRAAKDGFSAGEESWPPEELAALAESSAEAFSGNALLRPLVQDTLLPTAAYIAGPAEIAYFAQSQALYAALGARMPCVLPRAGFTLVQQPVARLMKKYGIELQDAFAGRERLRHKMERGSLTPGLQRQFASGEKSVRALLKKLRGALGKLDKTLAGALDTAERKMLFQFLKVQAKAGRAQNFRTGVLDRHEQQLTEALFPHHGPQERSLSLLPFLARHGLALLDGLEKQVRPGKSGHVIVHL